MSFQNFYDAQPNGALHVFCIPMCRSVVTGKKLTHATNRNNVTNQPISKLLLRLRNFCCSLRKVYSVRRGGRPSGGRQGPVASGVGDRPLSPVGGATGPPLFFLSRDFVANLKKKKLHLSPVAPHRAIGGYFWNFSERTYIFEILFFF